MEQVNRVMSTVFENQYSSTIVTVIILLYASLARPKLPNFMVKLFENPIFRVLFLSLIVYKGNRDPVFSIMIAIAFTVTMNLISQQRFFENFGSHDSEAGHSTEDGGHSTEDGDSMGDNDSGTESGDAGTGDAGTGDAGTGDSGSGTGGSGTGDSTSPVSVSSNSSDIPN